MSELKMKHLEVYGFDYDYTLASYSDTLPRTLYRLARDALVERRKYPEGIQQTDYDSSFAIRGLHFDTVSGCMLKLDSFQRICTNTLHYGSQRVSFEDTVKVYGGSHIPQDFINEYSNKKSRMKQMIDLYSLPKACLLAHLIDYFVARKISFAPSHLFNDVDEMFSMVHKSELIHRNVMDDIEQYLHPNNEVLSWLTYLKEHGKKLFLLTNSSFPFVNTGMLRMFGPDWAKLFDVIVVNAHKPAFFTSSTPFRMYDTSRDKTEWKPVSSLEPGKVYREGNLADFSRFTGWTGSKVIYFGDHVFSDLADASTQVGWRTGAIIKELRREVEMMNSPTYQTNLAWFLALRNLLDELQHVVGSTHPLRVKWRAEYNEYAQKLLELSHPRFVNNQGPSYFSRRLNHIADVYMSNVANCNQYQCWHTIYPRRTILAHEPINQLF